MAAADRGKLISVIIPVYNAEAYLGQCLDSVAGQTYTNLEIICVDDGSTDRSPEILGAYARRDSRFRIIHEENQGESHARNAGLSVAAGAYITFVDNDDWIEPDMYERLMELAAGRGLDLAAGGWYKERPGSDGQWTSERVVNEGRVREGVIDRDLLLHYLYERDRYRGFSYMWNKLYRRTILQDEKGNIRLFREDLKLGGDVIYLAEAALRAERSQYLDRPFYHYRIREKSGSHTESLQSYRDWIRSYEITIELYQANRVDQDILDYLVRFMGYHASEAAGIAIRQKNAAELAYFQRIMQDCSDCYIRLNQEHPDWIEQYRRRMETSL